MKADGRTGGRAGGRAGGAVRRVARVVAIGLPALAAGPSVLRSAQAADADSILSRALTAYQKVTTLRAEFTQHISDPMIGTDATSRGEFVEQRPSRFAMRWREPAGDVILSDGQTLWVYLPSSAPNQVVRSTIAPSGQNPDVVSEFLDHPHERFTISYVRADSVARRPAQVLSFVPRAQNSPYRRVLAWIDREDGLPHRFEITEASGAVRRITFDRLRINVPVRSSELTFRPPPGIRVVDATQP